MGLRTLDTELFVRHVQRVQAMLENPRQRECLLQAACADTPVVREIREACCYATAARADPRAAETLERMQQDLVTFLALREIHACAAARASLAARRVGVASDN